MLLGVATTKMHLLLSLFIFLSLSYNSLAVPTALRPQRHPRSFQVERIKRSDYVAHGPTALRKALRKFGITPENFPGIDLNDHEAYSLKPVSAISSNQNSKDTGQEGSVSATSVQSDVEFVSPVTIGGQTITMDFDTGSSDMWVMNTQMQSSMTRGHTIYNPQNSSTYKSIKNGEFKVSYGDSSWAYGGLASDTVSIGGATVQQQIFGLPNDVSDPFINDTHSNGLVGLGFGSGNTFNPGPQKTFFENLAPTLDEPVLTARLRSDGVGEYEFGTIDHSKYTGNLMNISVNSANGYWQIDTPMYGVQIGSWNVTSASPGSTAIVDTGTSLILANEAVVGMYYGQVPGSFYSNSHGGYIFPCIWDLPDFIIMVGFGRTVPVPGWALNFGRIDLFSKAYGQYCYGGLQGNGGAGFQILGDVFLKAYFVVFDQRGPSIGLAHHV